MFVELEALRAELSEASRHQSKPIKDKIMALERKKDHYSNMILGFEN